MTTFRVLNPDSAPRKDFLDPGGRKNVGGGRDHSSQGVSSLLRDDAREPGSPQSPSKRGTDPRVRIGEEHLGPDLLPRPDAVNADFRPVPHPESARYAVSHLGQTAAPLPQDEAPSPQLRPGLARNTSGLGYGTAPLPQKDEPVSARARGAYYKQPAAGQWDSPEAKDSQRKHNPTGMATSADWYHGYINEPPATPRGSPALALSPYAVDREQPSPLSPRGERPTGSASRPQYVASPLNDSRDRRPLNDSRDRRQRDDRNERRDDRQRDGDRDERWDDRGRDDRRRDDRDHERRGGGRDDRDYQRSRGSRDDATGRDDSRDEGRRPRTSPARSGRDDDSGYGMERLSLRDRDPPREAWGQRDDRRDDDRYNQRDDRRDDRRDDDRYDRRNDRQGDRRDQRDRDDHRQTERRDDRRSSVRGDDGRGITSPRGVTSPGGVMSPRGGVMSPGGGVTSPRAVPSPSVFSPRGGRDDRDGDRDRDRDRDQDDRRGGRDHERRRIGDRDDRQQGREREGGSYGARDTYGDRGDERRNDDGRDDRTSERREGRDDRRNDRDRDDRDRDYRGGRDDRDRDYRDRQGGGYGDRPQARGDLDRSRHDDRRRDSRDDGRRRDDRYDGDRDRDRDRDRDGDRDRRGGRDWERDWERERDGGRRGGAQDSPRPQGERQRHDGAKYDEFRGWSSVGEALGQMPTADMPKPSPRGRRQSRQDDEPWRQVSTHIRPENGTMGSTPGNKEAKPLESFLKNLWYGEPHASRRQR